MIIADPLVFVRGEVVISALDENGMPLWTSKHANLVTHYGRASAARCMAMGTLYRIGSDPTGAPSADVLQCFPDKIAVGTSDVPATADDAGITNAAAFTIFNAQCTANKVTFYFNIGYFPMAGEPDANGMTITELGLITREGGLFSRITRAPIEKSEHITLRGSWSIYFT